MNATPGRALVVFMALILLVAAGIAVWQGLWVMSGLEAFVQDSSDRVPPAQPSDIYLYAGNRAMRTIFGLSAVSVVAGPAIAVVALTSRARGS